MTSENDRKDLLLQRFRERLAEEDLKLSDAQDLNQHDLFSFLEHLGFNPVDNVKIKSLLRVLVASSDVAATSNNCASEVACALAPDVLGRPTLLRDATFSGARSDATSSCFCYYCYY